MGKRPLGSWRIVVAGLVAAPLIFGCSLINTAVNSAVNSALGGQAGTVANLWPDVPTFQGATKADIDLPVSVRVAIAGLVKAASAQGQAQGEGRLDKFDFIAFNTAGSATDVQEFYTTDRMMEAGWNSEDQPGCVGSFEAEINTGAFCIFGKTQGDESSVLLITAVPDTETGKTTIFYIRFEGATFNSQ